MYLLYVQVKSGNTEVKINVTLIIFFCKYEKSVSKSLLKNFIWTHISYAQINRSNKSTKLTGKKCRNLT